MVQALAPVIASRQASALLALGLLAAALPGVAEAQGGPKLKVPPGFAIDVFANKVGSVRFMAVDPSGTLLVSEPSAGRVLALPDKNADGKADSVQTVVTGLDQPHGLAFHEGGLYIAETSRVQRFAYDPATMKATQPTVLARLPSGGGHWTRTVVFGPDGLMYVSVGSSCNVCRESDKRRAAVLRFNADGSGETIFASGLRNAVGLAFHPTTGVLWATVNERDWRGDDVPPDYVTEIREGAAHGWPDCMTVRGRVITNTSFAKGATCDKVTPPTGDGNQVPFHGTMTNLPLQRTPDPALDEKFRLLVEGVTDAKAFHTLDELALELVGDRVGDDEALGGDAGLSVVDDAGLDGGGYGGVQIGAGHNDEGIAAT